jgi:ABC-type sulfate transport system substrate-binding protein
VNYVHSRDAKRALARHGFRSEDAEVMAEHASSFPKVEGAFRIDALGGWGEVVPKLFGKEGIFPRTWEAVYAGQ